MVVVVLGHELQSEGIHPQLQARMDAGIEAFTNTDATYLLLSGGQVNPHIDKTECEVMAEYAHSQGIDPTRIISEPSALDTIGNGYFTRICIDELGHHVETLYLVTSQYHAQRAKYIFKQCFGDTVEIDVSYCVDSGRETHPVRHRAKLDQVRKFFDPIPTGDMDAIRQRLSETHELYELTETTLTSATAADITVQ
ncbi:YdcF family protein [Haloprofundus sp. MHR1]|uniref:YdcF family protein n=1 Tax=Haloprofundus sp. MHR1 TaxID=2572921 RepID=UPI0010BE5341|nr:YdcF family protein [Haloprofundus sp. MHR1]QCJ45961.1 YdcF family protein [Haloprofundus sp. MHR1]